MDTDTYKTVAFSADPDEPVKFNSFLNEQFSNGWELHKVIPMKSTDDKISFQGLRTDTSVRKLWVVFKKRMP